MKILLLALSISISSIINIFIHDHAIINTPKFQDSLASYFICEFLGSRKPSSCNKDQLQQYSFRVPAAVAETMTIVLVPVIFILMIVEWRNSKEWIGSKFRKFCFLFIRGKNTNTATALTNVKISEIKAT